MTLKEYEVLPDVVKDIVSTYDEDEDPYKECERITSQLFAIGWQCDYDLSGVIFDIEPIKTNTYDY